MPEFASDASELTDGDASRGLARRRFLTFLVTAPALTVAARVGAEILTPARADAVVPSPPQPADVADFGDVMTALTRADTDLFVLQVSRGQPDPVRGATGRGRSGHHHRAGDDRGRGAGCPLG